MRAADQLAAALGQAILHSDRNAANRKGRMCGDDFIYTVRPAIGVMLWAANLIAKARNGFAADVVCRGAADDFAAVVSVIADCNDCEGHGYKAGLAALSKSILLPFQ